MTDPERFETNPARFVSCVSHVIRIYNQKTGKTVVIQPSGIVVRSSSAHINAREVGDIPVCEIEYGRVSHLPPFKAGVGLIVSAVCSVYFRSISRSHGHIYSRWSSQVRAHR